MTKRKRLKKALDVARAEVDRLGKLLDGPYTSDPRYKLLDGRCSCASGCKSSNCDKL